ncbi:hypothetical protein FisN_19Lh215 [Fistulifera solaris]|uniref:Solute carrier family 35 (UDP-sugar transporter), member A1/2/3 n=1 Tax=Fistulifera solaris TaxID=1519565 RepID=A0A1Z5J727_FISSO|nr:hypothetical protein FisN_19Lh215 [Fistulifera solaris]|eukprot:GAX09746.1 hypothetical protein FisN_19Lh215 [Fistulifera solaris]
MNTQTRSLLRIAVLVVVVSTFPAYSFTSPCRNPMRLLQSTSTPLQHKHNALHTTRQNRLIKTTRYASIASTWTSTATSTVGYLYMFLLALQFASQPILTQKFAPKTIVKSTYVLAQELVRLVTATSLLLLTGNWQGATRGWNYRVCFKTVGIPAVLYILQNRFSLTAYQHLSPITFNVLNQSKTLSAAIFCFLILGQAQSKVQMGALVLLLLAVFVMEVDLTKWLSPTNQKHENEDKTQRIRMSNAQRREYYLLGVIPVLLASAISGLAGALIQRTLQTRDSLLFSVELACISIGLLAGELLFVRPQQPSSTWTTGWSLWTWIPVVTNALGGILVGLVTKYAGAVEKGFALILGMVLSGALQNQIEHEQKRVSLQQWMGGLLAGISLWLHSQFPSQ